MIETDLDISNLKENVDTHLQEVRNVYLLIFKYFHSSLVIVNSLTY